MNVCRNYGMTCELANENGYCIITGCIKREYKVFSEAIPKPNKNLVEVVRCQDCKKSHIDGKTTHYLWCTEWGRSTDTFGYCERGEREGE